MWKKSTHKKKHIQQVVNFFYFKGEALMTLLCKYVCARDKNFNARFSLQFYLEIARFYFKKLSKTSWNLILTMKEAQKSWVGTQHERKYNSLISLRILIAF